jgi:hypothetical protein
MEQRREHISDLEWKLETLKSEIQRLKSEKMAAESFAAEAVRMSKQRDPAVEELANWYVHCRHFVKMSDMISGIHP